MNIIFFIKLILRNLVLLIAVPLILAATVFYFTKNETKYYSTKTSIYTGITSGYNIESGANSKVDYFATNNAFDNLVNIIKSRETLEEVSLRLLAQHLYLDIDHAVPKYISKKNYDELQTIVPVEIKEMVKRVKEQYPPGTLISQVKPKINPEEKTGKELKGTTPVFHFVKPDETLYSIAKKYNISVEKLMKINNLENYNINVDDRLLVLSGDDNQQKEIQVIKEDTNYYYTPEQDEEIISIAENFNTLVSNLIKWNNLTERVVREGQKIIVGGLETKKAFTDSLVVSGTEELNEDNKGLGQMNVAQGFSTYDKAMIDTIVTYLFKYKNASDTGFIYELLNYQHPHYSIKALSTIKPKRIGNSDLIEMSFELDDPGICQQALLILIDVFIENFKKIKENQTDAVVKYFQKQVNQATRRLQISEDKLLDFNEKNSIINYYEQTKFIAEQNEDLDLSYQEEKMKRASAEAALRKIENRLNLRGEINLASSEIVKKRKELGDLTTRIAMVEAFQSDSNAWELVYLKNKAQKIRDELEAAITELYSYNNTIQGMPLQDLLQEWLTKVMEYEESDAKMTVLVERKKEFTDKYNQFAPLGASLKRIEREIDIAEQEYMSLLNSLNEAKLKQQNIEFSSNIKPVDLPFYPIQPQPSKRKLLIIAAAFAGFILVLALIVLLEFFDTTLKNPENAEKVIGIPFGSVFPLLPSGFKKVDYPLIMDRLTDILFQNIQLKSGDIFNTKKQKVIAFISTRTQEGKSMISEKLFSKLKEVEPTTILLSPDDPEKTMMEGQIYYQGGIALSHAGSVLDLLPDGTAKLEEHHYILLELPALLYNSFSVGMYKSIDAPVLVARSNRTWNEADKRALDTFSNLSEKEPVFFLNGVSLEALESVIGEIPKKRSLMRQLLKRILKFQIHSKESFS